MKAVWNGATVAEAADAAIQQFDGNYYFPPESLNKNYVLPSETHSVCPWKGTASYYSLSVDGKINADAAWYYPEPKDAAAVIKNHIGFWKGVQIIQ